MQDPQDQTLHREDRELAPDRTALRRREGDEQERQLVKDRKPGECGRREESRKEAVFLLFFVFFFSFFSPVPEALCGGQAGKGREVDEREERDDRKRDVEQSC